MLVVEHTIAHTGDERIKFPVCVGVYFQAGGASMCRGTSLALVDLVMPITHAQTQIH